MVKRRIPRRKESYILQERNKRNWMGLFPDPKKLSEDMRKNEEFLNLTPES